MPQLPFTYTPISQRVADRVFDGTTLCQIATWKSITVEINQDALYLQLGFVVDYHSLLNGAPGPKIPSGKGLESWPQSLFANNDCAVYFNPSWVATATQPTDPRNGQILYYRGIQNTWESRDANGVATQLVGGLDAAPEPVIKQGDAFFMQMANPMVLAQLIQYHLNAANTAPFNKFA